MARVVAFEQNGRWLVKVDVDQYGGDNMSVAQAKQFASDVARAAQDAATENQRNKVSGR